MAGSTCKHIPFPEGWPCQILQIRKLQVLRTHSHFYAGGFTDFLVKTALGMAACLTVILINPATLGSRHIKLTQGFARGIAPVPLSNWWWCSRKEIPAGSPVAAIAPVLSNLPWHYEIFLSSFNDCPLICLVSVVLIHLKPLEDQLF